MSKYAIERPIEISDARRVEIEANRLVTAAGNRAWHEETRRLEALPRAMRVFPYPAGDPAYWPRGTGGGTY